MYTCTYLSNGVKVNINVCICLSVCANCCGCVVNGSIAMAAFEYCVYSQDANCPQLDIDDVLTIAESERQQKLTVL